MRCSPTGMLRRTSIPEPPDVCRRSDAGQQQQLRGLEGTPGEDDLAPGEHVLAARLRAPCLATLEGNPAGDGVRPHIEVRGQRVERVQIANGGGGAPLALLEQEEVAGSLTCRLEPELCPREAGLLTAVEEGLRARVHRLWVLDGAALERPVEIGSQSAALHPDAPRAAQPSIDRRGLEADPVVVGAASAQHACTALAHHAVFVPLGGGVVVVVELGAEGLPPIAQDQRALVLLVTRPCLE